jgi:triosephosphate isomerase
MDLQNKRKKVIAGNWKMNKTVREAVEFVTKLKSLAASISQSECEIVVCPPFTALYAVAGIIKGTNIHLGAQDTFWEQKGAFTGEISPTMLYEVGCEYVIVGHSERRQYFNETNEMVNKKMLAVLSVGLTPIVCVGETLEEREGNRTFDVIEGQVRGCLKGIDGAKADKIIIAYEPVWAIGTGRNATPEQAQEVQSFIRRLYGEMYNPEVSLRIPILYGGSISPNNISSLIHQPDVDGGLVGGASLDVEAFVKIIHLCCS